MLAVTALLAALGVSGYHTHIVREQVSAGIALAACAQRHVEDAFRRDGLPPADRRQARLGAQAAGNADRYVESIDIANGRIDIRFGHGADPSIEGRTLPLTPYETATLEIVWICGNRIPSPGLQPLGFAGGGPQAVQVTATIEPRYLPSTCR